MIARSPASAPFHVAPTGHMRHGATVLVVDDDADIVETMRDILADEGHVVVSAANGREALEVARRTHPDLVLLDLEMPEMDGRSFLRAVREDATLADTRIVILSGCADASDLGAETVLKPLRLDTLLGLIDRAAQVAE
jgi:CheY-like chemotaxis protein